MQHREKGTLGLDWTIIINKFICGMFALTIQPIESSQMHTNDGTHIKKKYIRSLPAAHTYNRQ